MESDSSTMHRERIEAMGGEVVDAVRRIVHEGNVRRIIVKQDEAIIAEFPLTIGVIGAAVAPMLAAVSAIVAVLARCTIEIERVDAKPTPIEAPKAPAPPEPVRALD